MNILPNILYLINEDLLLVLVDEKNRDLFQPTQTSDAPALPDKCVIAFRFENPIPITPIILLIKYIVI
jgi:hypothetical protein